ncbi:hypothetical protein [Hoeflea sp.]|uniref:hypothetical protein n=1 Tax=Hoeflea sp. TaxID=1940281 RepID=UPI003B023408
MTELIGPLAAPTQENPLVAKVSGWKIIWLKSPGAGSRTNRRVKTTSRCVGERNLSQEVINEQL